MTPDHEVQLTVQLARTLAGADGRLTGAQLRDLAGRARVSTRTVRRWLDNVELTPHTSDQAREASPEDAGTAADDIVSGCLPPLVRGRRSAWTPTREHLVVIAGCDNLAQAHRDMRATDPTVPSYPTFRRAVGALDPGIAAAITRKGGAPALHRNHLYLRVEAEYRNKVWAMDAQEIPVRVVPGGNRQPQKYWQTTAIDDATRMVMATVITPDRPTSDVVAACIAQGIRGQVLDGTYVGGVPETIIWDNGGEFVAGRITEMALALRFTGSAMTPYAPWEKGKIESWHRTIQREFYSTLPGNTHGPQSHSRKALWEPTLPTHLLTGDLLTAQALMWVEHYNITRPHSSLSGRTPLEAWRADTGPVRQVEPEALYSAMLSAKGTRTVSKNGLRFRNIDYVCAELNEWVGREVTVRHLPHDASFIEVFNGADHVATAYPVGRLTPGQRRELLHVRRDQYNEARALMTAAAAARQERHDDAVMNATRTPASLVPLSSLDPAPRDMTRGHDLDEMLDLLTPHPGPADDGDPICGNLIDGDLIDGGEEK